MLHTRILTLVQVSNTSNNCLFQGRLPMLHTQIIMLVQAPYACAGSQHLPRKTLRCAGSRQFESLLMPVMASNNSHTNPDACAGSQQFKQFLMPGKASDHSQANPYALQVSTILKIPYTCAGFQKFTSES
ncbi:hypothetical protein O181_033718 [Austropuccinia psidii MF-1]|uniref:Uncharacterized protein n=1 Tax=Austropuccinia psidii MF-1 TaxID=1389203 RepID=A0A9Q3H6Q1_9BASI|nr:hypothetical protein [Austropuccinia psidii MF-1]